MHWSSRTVSEHALRRRLCTGSVRKMLGQPPPKSAGFSSKHNPPASAHSCKSRHMRSKTTLARAHICCSRAVICGSQFNGSAPSRRGRGLRLSLKATCRAREKVELGGIMMSPATLRTRTRPRSHSNAPSFSRSRRPSISGSKASTLKCSPASSDARATAAGRSSSRRTPPPHTMIHRSRLPRFLPAQRPTEASAPTFANSSSLGKPAR